jgi:hypothetical protein
MGIIEVSISPIQDIDKDGFNLGKWVSHRRNNYKNGKLLSDHIQELETVEGWFWGARVK